MIFNQKKKFIFIEVPKTGTSAIASMLLRLDPDNHRNKLPRPDGTMTSVSTHISYREVEEILGEDMQNYTFVAFLRNPIDIVISKYFFYKVGRSRQQVRDKTASPGLVARVLFSMIAPLPIWALLYPYKSTSRFIIDENDDVQVQHVGDFDSLQQEVNRIFSNFGYSRDDLQLMLENKSNYRIEEVPFFNLTKSIVSLKSSRDVQLYEREMRKNQTPLADEMAHR